MSQCRVSIFFNTSSLRDMRPPPPAYRWIWVPQTAVEQFYVSTSPPLARKQGRSKLVSSGASSAWVGFTWKPYVLNDILNGRLSVIPEKKTNWQIALNETPKYSPPFARSAEALHTSRYYGQAETSLHLSTIFTTCYGIQDKSSGLQLKCSVYNETNMSLRGHPTVQVVRTCTSVLNIHCSSQSILHLFLA